MVEQENIKIETSNDVKLIHTFRDVYEPDICWKFFSFESFSMWSFIELDGKIYGWHGYNIQIERIFGENIDITIKTIIKIENELEKITVTTNWKVTTKYLSSKVNKELLPKRNN
jgi:hypothetical protein